MVTVLAFINNFLGRNYVNDLYSKRQSIGLFGYSQSYTNGNMFVFFVSILFGFKEMVLSFSVSFRKNFEKKKLIEALNFFKIYGKITWIAGLIAVLIGVIAMLADLADKTALGLISY
jgi:vacuolar-type H+-ATPase subunit I/STV1